MTALHEWQGHRGVSDDLMAKSLRVSRPTWVRWRDGKGQVPHDKLVMAVNVLRIPKGPATEILMKGYRE